jgi:hypothetical protein
VSYPSDIEPATAKIGLNLSGLADWKRYDSEHNLSKMYQELEKIVADLIAEPRPLKAQTERQLSGHLSEHNTDLSSFLTCASEVLEDYELDILFASNFTPGLQSQAQVAKTLCDWTPAQKDIDRLVDQIGKTVDFAIVLLPDETEAKLMLHEVMVERYIKLLNLQRTPATNIVAMLQEVLPDDQWPIAAALLRQRGFTAKHQTWYAHFVRHLAGEHEVDEGLLVTLADFVGNQTKLDPKSLLDAAGKMIRASEGSASYAENGHSYWSPDVAQHHQYRGQGHTDKDLIQQRKNEVVWFKTIEKSLQTYDGGPA